MAEAEKATDGGIFAQANVTANTKNSKGSDYNILEGLSKWQILC